MQQIPEGLCFNPNKIPKLFLTGRFLFVNDIGKATQCSLSDALSFWTVPTSIDLDIVFHRGVRIAGTYSNILLSLLYADVPNNDIENILSRVITRDNYYDPITKQYNEQYLAEIEFFAKLNKIPALNEVPYVNFNNILRMIRIGEPWIIKYFVEFYQFDLRSYDNKAYYVAIETDNQDVIDMIGNIIIEQDYLYDDIISVM